MDFYYGTNPGWKRKSYMSRSGDPVGKSNHVLLRWLEGASANPREEFVEILNSDSLETVLRTTSEIRENTKVQLIGSEYKRFGTVRCCEKNGLIFALTVALEEEFQSGTEPSGFDPGVLAVEDFITAEQEAEVLKDLEDENWTSVNLISFFCSGPALNHMEAFKHIQRFLVCADLNAYFRKNPITRAVLLPHLLQTVTS